MSRSEWPTSGPEHYREAERLLRYAAYDTADAGAESRDADRDADFLRAAQVHATLALAAATAFQPSGYAGAAYTEWRAWADVARVDNSRQADQRGGDS